MIFALYFHAESDRTFTSCVLIKSGLNSVKLHLKNYKISFTPKSTIIRIKIQYRDASHKTVKIHLQVKIIFICLGRYLLRVRSVKPAQQISGTFAY